MKGPYAAYQAALASGDYQHDPAQDEVAAALQIVYEAVTVSTGRWSLFRRPKAVSGLYVWGGVGRGKTWLMDLFFNSLPDGLGTRIHFHRFMLRVHKALSEHVDQSDPLRRIAEEWAGNSRVLCLDEFFVSDIGDAMLLAGLLEGLFDEGVTLITTSNVIPDGLYADGLQRARFLPAIELLKQNTDVLELQSATDYRLRILQSAKTWYVDPGDSSEERLRATFERICPADSAGAGMIAINDRSIPTVRRGDGVIWFQFDSLFRSNRSASDYIEIARSFNTVLISDIPLLTDLDSDAAKRFVTAIDEFYDRSIKLIATAAAAPHELYQGTRLSFEFERTSSRLIEMQSNEYLATEHRP